ncbi:MAG: DUF1801 domain-containing protein [Agarilytica sp.]
MNKEVQFKFDSYPDVVRPKMMALREHILDVAENTEDVGGLVETLKWGEPAYLTAATKSGTTIRIDWKPNKPDQYAMYVNCRTSLVDTYRSLFPELSYDGDRAIVFDVKASLPENELRTCIKMALRYHLDKHI